MGYNPLYFNFSSLGFDLDDSIFDAIKTEVEKNNGSFYLDIDRRTVEEANSTISEWDQEMEEWGKDGRAIGGGGPPELEFLLEMLSNPIVISASSAAFLFIGKELLAPMLKDVYELCIRLRWRGFLQKSKKIKSESEEDNQKIKILVYLDSDKYILELEKETDQNEIDNNVSILKFSEKIYQVAENANQTD